jgi:D-psicose/D-tagatose/L-ribulose 3-epimerase
MRLAISNIAWPAEEDEQVAHVLHRYGVEGVEIAPTKVWPSPLDATAAEIRGYRSAWSRRGIPIVAAQALLFGRPDLTIFDNITCRNQTRQYLERIIWLCAELGAEALVFGSPANRRIGHLPQNVVREIAVEFFAGLARVASRHGTVLVVEPNPPQYQADFVTCAQEAIALVTAVNHAAFRLHLDSGCMTLSRESVPGSVSAASRILWHFHVSEPFLAPIGEGGTDHAVFARALRAITYDRWVSIEVKPAEPFALGDVARSIVVAKKYYGSP